MQVSIAGATASMTEDFDGRTALYRQIYSYIMTHSGSQVRRGLRDVAGLEV